MKIVLAKSAGFCYGVRRAVELAEEKAAQGVPCVMLGSLIHNKDVVERLAARGLHSVDRPDRVPDGSAVIIRSHGESRAVFEDFARRGITVFDATCPNVTRIHNIVREAEARGRIPVIVGEVDHPEILGILGCTKHGIVVSGWEELEETLTKDQSL